MRDAPRVVHVLDRVKAGHGRGLSALAIAGAQHRAGWHVRLLVCGVQSPELLPAEPPPEALLGQLDAEVYRDPCAIGAVSGALERLAHPGETIVCHEGVDLAAACRVPGRRVVAAVHSHPEECLEYLPASDLAAVARTTDRWISWGSPVAGKLASAHRVEPWRITVSAQPVAVSECRPARLAGSPACLTAARIHPIKNHALVLEALACLAERSPGVHWHMAGGAEDPGYLGSLQQLARGLGVGDRVTWHGHRPDVAALMRGSDVTVLASHREGVPRAIQEAMAHGVPTVMPALLAGDLTHAGLPVTYHEASAEGLAAAVEEAVAVDAGHRRTAARWVRRRWGEAAVLRDWERALAS
jgi:glycosyltransferase involved in cell wall biosynthesis